MKRSGGKAGRSSRSASSRRWLQRQHADPLVRRAREEGYRARSVYKLQEIDRRFGLLRRGMSVIDLGAAPGSWTQYAVRRGCRVIAVDRLPFEPVSGAETMVGDFLDPVTRVRIRDRLAGMADVVLSDLAANATGRRSLDRLRCEALAEEVLGFAVEVLRPGGDLLLKLAHGAEMAIREPLRASFRTVRLVRPKATRRESSEVFLLAREFHQQS